MLNTKPEYLHRVLCDLAYKLDDEMMEHEESLLDREDEDGGPCLHYLLDSTPEEPHVCEQCQQSWADLLRECGEDFPTVYHGLPMQRGVW